MVVKMRVEEGRKVFSDITPKNNSRVKTEVYGSLKGQGQCEKYSLHVGFFPRSLHGPPRHKSGPL